MENRPTLNREISVQDFKEFYWLKAELIAFCRQEGLSRQGGKIAITERIVTFLQTGEKGATGKKPRVKVTSNFDWNNAPLQLSTPITDNYKNTENVRSFLQQQLGKQFKFNVKFMNWMKQNVGKTLADAIAMWQAIETERKGPQRKEIAPQFEYNRYLRDFLEDNPDKSRETAIQFWKAKRARRGDNAYQRSDLTFAIEQDE